MLATDRPIALACAGGLCTAEFSTYCLQRERPNPTPGTAYRAEGGPLTLVLTDRAGAVRRIPADDLLSIDARRTYTSVRIGLSEDVLLEHGATAAALDVGERVSLIPAPLPDDSNPQSNADIALAIGPQRALGDRLVDSDIVDAGAVRLTARLLNALPRYGRASPARRENLWRDAIGPDESVYPPESVARARSELRRCAAKVSEGRFFSLRQCLELGHDGLMLDLNVRYWKAGPEG